MAHHSYCQTCGKHDPEIKHVTTCDICAEVVETSDVKAELTLASRSNYFVQFTICKKCFVKLLPHAVIKVEDVLNGFHPEVVEELKEVARGIEEQS